MRRYRLVYVFYLIESGKGLGFMLLHVPDVRSTWVSREILLSSISVMALIVPLALANSTASAQESVSSRELFGLKGSTPAIAGKYVPQAGSAGGDISIVNTYSSPKDSAKGGGVRFGSMGGSGGDGFGNGLGIPGAAGAKGGDLFILQNGALMGRGNQAVGAALPTDLVSLCNARMNSDFMATCLRTGALYALDGIPPLPPHISAYDPRWVGRGGVLLLAYSQGGNGGNAGGVYSSPAGNGGTVNLTVNAPVTAEGNNYGGVWARSLGGNTAPGGLYGSRAMDPATYKGGDSGAVSVTINNTVSTLGASAPGVIAESLAGAAMNAGPSLSAAATLGAHGGKAGLVTFQNAGAIITIGASSPGVLLQSVGGNGGSSVNGKGGKGGIGGDILGTNGGVVSTTGDYGFGLLALSAGGNGGKGASGIFAGSDGGVGGVGGSVRVGNFGTIKTNGEGSAAFVAVSVAGGNAIDAFQTQTIKPDEGSSGGGGAGGNAWFWAGDGGAGGNGGLVQVMQNGTIKTDGKGAFGMVAQSIGGGGGDGGAADNRLPVFSLAVGGRGGGGGDGGDVMVLNSAYLDPVRDKDLAAERAWALKTVPGSHPSVPSITTSGDGATGLIAMSVGGSGGIGGSSAGRSASVGASVSIAVGGAGGAGGNGGKVFVDNESLITTSGKEAGGIFAESIGGGGGLAGNTAAYALAVSPPDYPAISISASIGGSGGAGGNGGEVDVINRAAIITGGEKSHAITALSVGGGGGDGSVAKSVSDAVGFFLNVQVTAAFGGTGGGGGSGGTVHVENWSDIQTAANFSRGISAISIGGGGGVGGTGDTKAAAGISWQEYLTLATSALPLAKSISVNTVMGGTGGLGGQGGEVAVRNYQNILTGGINSKGIHAQSIGGGGGDAGGYMASGNSAGANVTFTMGGGAGGTDSYGANKSGGNGGYVLVKNAAPATIETRGAGSVGIFAQSIGGGGGDGGGFAGTVKAAPSFKDLKFYVQLADEIFKAKELGEYVNKQLQEKPKDKDAQDAKKALDEAGTKVTGVKPPQPPTVEEKLKQLKSVLKLVKNGIKVVEDAEKNPDDVLAAVNNLVLFAGGAAVEMFKGEIKKRYEDLKYEKAYDVPPVDLSLAIGGTGGSGGQGGTVELFNDGKLTTLGDNSIAVFAQSVGGGGGRGGASLATGTNQLNLNVSIGGKGGGGGNGGTVIADNTGSIATEGAGSFGMFAQSVGGGGGYGGGAASANSISISANVKVGGSGGVSSDGGKVTLHNSGTVSTLGKEAHGLVAQSVGGGGGTFFLARVDPDEPEVVSDSADMAEVQTLLLDMMKTVSGNYLASSTATPAQKAEAEKVAALLKQDLYGSTGGATGDASSTILPTPQVAFSFGGDGGKGGNGGEVTVIHSGAVHTTGIGAFGIFAQSIGGGGGFGADAGNEGFLTATMRMGGTGGTGGTAGDGGNIWVKLEKGAEISTSGDKAHGVFLQSIGGGGGYGGVAGERSTSVVQEQINVIEYVSTGPFTSIPVVVTRGASGNGGLISIDASEGFSLVTMGAQAHGIYAQSLGGGGGASSVMGAKNIPVVSNIASRDARYMTGQGGEIRMQTTGNIQALGSDSYGVFFQSGVQKVDQTLDPTRLGANIRIRHDGILWGGSGDGAAIRIDAAPSTPSNWNRIRRSARSPAGRSWHPLAARPSTTRVRSREISTSSAAARRKPTALKITGAI